VKSAEAHKLPKQIVCSGGELASCDCIDVGIMRSDVRVASWLVGLVLPACTHAYAGLHGPCYRPQHMLATYGVQPAPQMVATAFDLGTYMEEKRVLTEAALDRSLESKCKETEVIVESMRYSLLAGGKRVRPMLVYAATEMFGGSLDSVGGRARTARLSSCGLAAHT